MTFFANVACSHNYTHTHTHIHANHRDLRRNRITTVEDGTFALRNVFGLEFL